MIGLINQENISSQKSFKSTPKLQTVAIPKGNQLTSYLVKLFRVINHHENYLQSVREALIIQNKFDPKTLFFFLSKGQQFITKQNIVQFMQKNEEQANQAQIKIVFNMNGIKDKMSYRQFLNFIFPYDKDTLGKINIKKFVKNQGIKITQEIFCLFTMIFKGQITFLYEFDETRKQLFPQMNKQSIKRLITQIKEIGSSQTQIQSKNVYVITHQQFINSIKSSKYFQRMNIYSILRKLSQCHEASFVTFQQLMFWFKSWDKILQGLRSFSGISAQQSLQRTYDFNDSLDEEINEFLTKGL